MIGKIETRVIPLDRMNPAPYNPRVKLAPGDTEYESLRRSIETFGCVELIVWNESTGNIVHGHQRYQVLKDLELEEVETAIVHLDQVKEKALNLALNRIGSQWDMELLASVLSELADEGIAELTGFGEQEIERIVAQLEAHSYIDDLLQDEFVDRGQVSSYFDVSFTFEAEHRETITGYIKEHGKAPIVQMIVEFVKEEATCQSVEVK